jgi:hypothetical protein
MPAKNPRLTAVVDPSIMTWLKRRATAQGTSVSLLVRDLLVRVRDEDEEAFWAAAGERRLASFVRDEAVEHEKAWK